MDPISAGIGAGVKILGGLLGRSSAKKAAEKQAQRQKSFAQKGIRWRVKDAKAAGIHPLYALGAQTHSYQPVTVNDPLPDSLADAGQDISRAVLANGTSSDRAAVKLDALRLENMGLHNELLRVQINKLAGPQLGPPIPEMGSEIKPAEVTAANPVFPYLEAGPPRPGGVPADFWGGLKLNLLSDPVAQSTDDMELLKYYLLLRDPENRQQLGKDLDLAIAALHPKVLAPLGAAGSLIQEMGRFGGLARDIAAQNVRAWFDKHRSYAQKARASTWRHRSRNSWGREVR